MEFKLNFQTVMLGVFAAGAVVGIALFSGAGSSGGGGGAQGLQGEIAIWGSEPSAIFGSVAKTLGEQYEGLEVTYREIDPELYDQELTRALAEGEGPDLFFVDNTTALEHRNKALILPFENYPLEIFQSTYVDEGQLFVRQDGIMALPVMIDPMVMYYNKDILRSSFLIDPPEYWDELFSFAPAVTEQTDSGAIQQSAVALGSYQNINHVKDIFSLIMMQSGNPLVAQDAEGQYMSTFQNNNVAQSVARFFTVFSNPAQDAYSWNPSLPSSRQEFLAGDLALYFGYASELASLRDQNPNLNFDVALMLQTRDRATKVTHGNVTGLAISKASPNVTAAFTLATEIAGDAWGQSIADAFNLPPAQKANLRNKPTEPYRVVFYNSALIARGWLDPDQDATQNIFNDLIRDTVSGLLNPAEAVSRADSALTSLLERI